MNIQNLEVKVKKIKIKTKEDSSLCFSLRLGRVLSILSTPVPNKSGEVLELNVDLIIGCQENLLNSNNRACLVIYEINTAQQRDIIGMVFILLKNQQDEVHRYRIQQSNDPASFLELSFNIANIEVKQKENQSLASKSSLAQIKQFHRVLTFGHKKTCSDHSHDLQEFKKQKLLASQDAQRQNKDIIRPNKIQHIKSQQTEPFLNQQPDPSYTILLKRLQKELAKQRERNSILTNLLVIEQTKNIQSQNMLKNIINFLSSNQQSNEYQSSTIRYEDRSINIVSPRSQFSQKSPREYDKKDFFPEENKNKATKQNSEKENHHRLQQIMNERDYLYSISQQLYEKTKKYREENEKMYNHSKHIENQLKIFHQEVQQLRQQNLQLKRKLFEIYDQKKQPNTTSPDKLSTLMAQNERLLNQNTQYERKFKQSYRAIQQFKNDAWKAQYEIILKDQQIASLKQQLENIKNNGESAKNSMKDRDSSNSYIKEQKQIMQTQDKNVQAFKRLSTLIINNNQQRNSILAKLEKSRSNIESKEIDGMKIVNNIKEKMNKMYREYEVTNKKTISVVEMRKNFMNVLNSINF